MALTRSGSITNGSGEHARHLYSVGKKLVAQAARANSGRVLTSEVAKTVVGLSVADAERGDSFFMLGSFAFVFDAADFTTLGATIFLVGFCLTAVVRGVKSLSDSLSKRTSSIKSQLLITEKCR
jgi:hypothetical protein